MKRLLDQGLPRSTVGYLQAHGVVAEHVGDLGIAAFADAEILSEAVKRQAVVVTLDADFHAILAMTGAAQPSVIRFRLEGRKGAELARRLVDGIAQAQQQLTAGAVVTVTARGVRIRRLPIRS